MIDTSIEIGKECFEIQKDGDRCQKAANLFKCSHENFSKRGYDIKTA